MLETVDIFAKLPLGFLGVSIRPLDNGAWNKFAWTKFAWTKQLRVLHRHGRLKTVSSS